MYNILRFKNTCDNLSQFDIYERKNTILYLFDNTDIDYLIVSASTDVLLPFIIF